MSDDYKGWETHTTNGVIHLPSRTWLQATL